MVGLASGAGARPPLDAELGWRDRADALIRDAARRDAVSAEAQFAAQMRGTSSRWTVASAPLRDAVLTACRSVDLVVAPFERLLARRRRAGDPRTLDIVLHGARPVLLAPPGAPAPRFRQIVVGWKDGPEARRALADALPLLVRAKTTNLVIVRESGEDHGGGDWEDIVAYLAAHGARAEVSIETSAHGSVADGLHAAAEAADADLIVAGCLGRGRLRESLLGGVTRDLLARPERYMLLSR